MAHIKVSKTRAEQTSPEWLKVGAQLGEVVNTWAGRGDLVAYVGPGAGGPAPACFNPTTAEIEVNVDVAFGSGLNPELIGDLRVRSTQFEWPRASGAIFHEALHARYSLFDLQKAVEDLSSDEYHALSLLEETRIEGLGVKNFPGNRVFLRACAMDIVLADIKEKLSEATSTRMIASLAALTCARVDAGSLDRDDIIDVNTLVLDFLGEELYGKLRDIWLEFQLHTEHRDPRPLYILAKRWTKLVDEAAEERGEPESGTPELTEGMKKLIKEILDAIEEAGGEISIAVGDEIQDQEQKEEWKADVDMRGKAARQKQDHEKAANEVFSKTTSDMGTIAGTNSRLKERRVPEGPERAAAIKIAQMLEKAKYRERDETEINSILPPGRLRTRAVVQGAAYKAQGKMTQVEAWRHTKRKHTDDPTLNVGVMVDISGSMSSAMNPMAVTAWAMSEAVRRVQGKCAMVYYGEDVFPTLKPGQHLDQINVYTAPDGTEKFDKAFKALDGSLNLLHGTGARLLVVVSDGCYTPQETEKAIEWMRECDKNGVAVLWIPFVRMEHHIGYVNNITKGTNAVVVSDATDPTAAAMKIGQAAATALTSVGRKNAA